MSKAFCDDTCKPYPSNHLNFCDAMSVWELYLQVKRQTLAPPLKRKAAPLAASKSTKARLG